MINAEVFSKKTEARKYPTNEDVLPINVSMQSALRKSLRFVLTPFILHYHLKHAVVQSLQK